jgi:hypothetical protein
MVILIIHPSLIVLHIFSYRIVIVKFNAGSNHACACAFPSVKAEYISSHQNPPSEDLSKMSLFANRQWFNEPPETVCFFSLS